MSLISKNNITGIILAGGKSSRMGEDKGMMMIDGEASAKRIARKLEVFCGKVIIASSNEQHKLLQYELVEDMYPMQGPLAGLQAALSYSSTQANLVLSCDVPMIDDDVLQSLIDAHDGSSLITWVSAEGKEMPLVGIYDKSCADYFEECLKQDERRVRVACGQLSKKVIHLEGSLALSVHNFNTPEDLKIVELCKLK
ncbi:molybdenum cofactor guanylyltransferase [Aureibacter tunicatorum]|uniref:Probable molybdenum cofactor guanylyltransferase n=1 Tax=Aureibacter tunicatorum TaxID=866807 RepID=A0AAE4BRC5_9BACT|nr:molybdenum cofactor guanylyltransferase [Aureibacter tunicatorum]MDR6237808.1 molybdopterin-guanine dinucleotide biosynthesis protein A [Aureibacter tunicatorum]BDD02843.1 putative molybdenum cofactor guanylyltransferase [Aureibacter tunicatorum]